MAEISDIRITLRFYKSLDLNCGGICSHLKMGTSEMTFSGDCSQRQSILQDSLRTFNCQPQCLSQLNDLILASKCKLNRFSTEKFGWQFICAEFEPADSNSGNQVKVDSFGVQFKANQLVKQIKRHLSLVLNLCH